MKDFDYALNRLQRDLDSLREEYSQFSKFTAKFLKVCRLEGIEKVSIGRDHRSIESSRGFVFGPKGSVFSDERSKSGDPAVWNVVQSLNISGGAGNGGQHQVSSDAMLIEGVYHFKKGRWFKVDLLEDEDND